jgi:hypothetical protein
MTQGRRERVFLVRMWSDAGAAADGWRGSVHEVGTDRRFYLTAPGEIAEYIATALYCAGPAEPENSD